MPHQKLEVGWSNFILLWATKNSFNHQCFILQVASPVRLSIKYATNRTHVKWQLTVPKLQVCKQISQKTGGALLFGVSPFTVSIKRALRFPFVVLWIYNKVQCCWPRACLAMIDLLEVFKSPKRRQSTFVMCSFNKEAAAGQPDRDNTLRLPWSNCQPSWEVIHHFKG